MKNIFTNRRIMQSVMLSMFLASFTSVSFAQKNNPGSNGAANGQPFQDLQSQIDANADLIADNADGLSDLQGQIDDLGDRVGDVEANVSSLEGEISLNAAAIQSALDQIDTTQQAVNGLADGLTALAGQHAFDIGVINDLLAGIDDDIDDLNQAREDLAAALATQLAALSAAIGSNAIAIDSMLLNLVVINAELTSLNSDILSLSQRQDDLEAASADYASLLADLGARASSLESAVAVLQGYHTTTFSGIQTNISLSGLNGWSVCYQTLYSAGTHPENIEAACSGSKIMLACRQTGSDTLTVAAYANRDEVFTDTGNGGNVVHTANGADWYLSGSYSMGFAPVGEGVRRTSADTQNTHRGDRLSWHTHDYGVGGWRCGSATGLNGSTAWEKLVLEAD